MAAKKHHTPEQINHLLRQAEVELAGGQPVPQVCRKLEVSEPADLRPLVGLSAVYVLDVFHHGVACVGFEFGCVWDEEHGAGVMTHRGRVIATGQADCSFVEWIAREGLDQE
jgi:hypothetical protein